MNDMESSLLKFSIENFKEISNFQGPKKGGQKYVFRGEHDKYGDIALKYIVCKSDNTIERAKREIETCYKLRSSNFAKIYEHGLIKVDNETFIYIIEEFIDGKTLKDELQDKHKLSEEEALNIGLELLNALSEIHSLNLVHRDVKPENIIIDGEHVYLLDMGIIRDLDKESITSDLAMFGPMTLGYAAPEQITNGKYLICNRTDLFSWAVVMYECISGVNPFCENCNTSNEVLTKTLNYQPRKLKIGNEALADVIALCLNKAVHRRPYSCEVITNILKG